MSATTLAFQTYLDAIRKTPLDHKTEHTDRGALETLLKTLSPAGPHIQHEPTRQGTKGSPDFKVTQTAAILGYIEVKTIGENLDAVLKSPQIKKYLTLSGNIILTDYLHFIWLHNGAVQQRDSLAYPTDLAAPKFKINPDRAQNIAALIANFFSQPPIGLARAQDLAAALATRSHLLREGLTTELTRQQTEHTQGKLYGLLAAFRAQVFHDLSLADFADAFAQMLSYGLFLARLNISNDAKLTLDNARTYIPAAFPLIRELVDFTTELNAPDYDQIRWIVEEILSIMNALNLADIRRDLSFANRKSSMRKVKAGSEAEHRLFERDPFVYFYEDFLAKYDAKLRKSRGVYYTPPPVVNFIIRAIDDILKTEFAIPTGLADHNRVTMLDFATGTGTFILEALERMFETIGDNPARRDLVVREHILKNIYGFEYLIAPYTIAHLKLSQYLADKGHKLAGHERLQVYLTNTLEPIAPQSNFLLPALSAEAEKAQEIKKKPILVITGNPPYSGHSKNNGAWIARQIDAYKFVDGKPLGERNPKWLNDDYVKFIRFAQNKIDQVPEGIVGIITNHSFLDNPTFRGMRQSLMASFNKIYVLDLHGNAKKKEKSPDGSKDENVFDIEQGVAISLLIKTKPTDPAAASLRAQRSNPSSPASQPPQSPISTVNRADLHGTRLGKYEACARLSLNQVDWRWVLPATPFYLFETGDAVLQIEYNAFISVTQIFPLHVLGFQTHRDDFAIAFTEADIVKRISDMRDQTITDYQFREIYYVKDNRDWQLGNARVAIRADHSWDSDIVSCAYRPFDKRWCHFGYATMDYPRRELIKNVLHKENISLLTTRQTRTQWKHAFVANGLAESCCVSLTTTEGNYNFALYTYLNNPEEQTGPISLFDEANPLRSKTRIENIAPAFRTTINTTYGTSPALTPEQIFGYIYAILHAPTYRARYAEFLRGDFPRIPLAPGRENFESFATLGWDLAQKHLLKEIPANPVQYRGLGDNTVEKPRYAEAEQAAYINATQFFAPIPEPVWNFCIGGYQVIEKYLKSRKGRTLTLDEVTTIEHITAVLAYTITQMTEIDTAYLTAFPTHTT